MNPVKYNIKSKNCPKIVELNFSAVFMDNIHGDHKKCMRKHRRIIFQIIRFKRIQFRGFSGSLLIFAGNPPKHEILICFCIL